MDPNQATHFIIYIMEVPNIIGAKTVKTLSDKFIVRTWNGDSTKYHISQYKHIIDHEGHYKLFLNFRERATH